MNFSPYTRFLTPMLGPGLDFWPGPRHTFLGDLENSWHTLDTEVSLFVQ